MPGRPRPTRPLVNDPTGVAHEPAGAPAGVVLLAHGAGGNRDSTMLQPLCEGWARRGFLAIRYDLPFRRRRPKGPPSGSGAGDRDGITRPSKTLDVPVLAIDAALRLRG